MKTSFTFTIKVKSGAGGSLTDVDEVESAAKAINKRYGVVNETLLEDPALPSSSNWRSYIMNTPSLRADLQIIDNLTRYSSDVGVYVISHGSTGTVACLNGELWAGLIKGLGFNNIRKLSFVTCYGASQKAKDGGVCQSFIQSVCMKLAPELTPMVAGYSEYVTVMVPESNLAVYKDPNVKPTL
jgi:hypothetical protein